MLLPPLGRLLQSDLLFSHFTFLHCDFCFYFYMVSRSSLLPFFCICSAVCCHWVQPSRRKPNFIPNLFSENVSIRNEDPSHIILRKYVENEGGIYLMQLHATTRVIFLRPLASLYHPNIIIQVANNLISPKHPII